MLRNHIIEREAGLNSIDPDLSRAIIWIESQGDSKAKSVTGCRGIGQINKGNAKYFGYKHIEMHEDEPNQIVMHRLLKEAGDYWDKNKILQKKEDRLTWQLREYNKGRKTALSNFLAGLTYAKIVKLAYQAIKNKTYVYKVGEKTIRIDIDKVNGVQNV